MKRFWLPSIFLCLFVASQSQAVCPQPQRKACSAYFSSDVVFSGTIASVEEVPEADDFIEGWRYRVNVAEVFKGPHQSQATVHTSNDSGRLLLEVGKFYVLFAIVQGDDLEVGADCGSLQSAEHARETVDEVRRLLSVRDSVIEGQISRAYVLGPGIPGVSVEVFGPGTIRKLVTDNQGWFHVSVKPGSYRVSVDPRFAATFDLSTDNPDRLILQAGQCAQLQFVKR